MTFRGALSRVCGRGAALSVLLALAGIVAAASASAAPIRYQLKMPTVVSYELMLPTLVADGAGLLAEQGIDLSELALGSGGTMRAAVIAREYDFGLFGFIHIPLARLAGSPWKALLATHDREIFNLVVRSEHRGRVRTVRDLRGMRVGFSTPGASAWYIGSVFLKAAGLDPERDVQYVPLGGDPAVIYTALRTGRVDAFVAWEPTTTRVIEEGIAYPLTRLWEEGEHRRWLGAPRAQSMFLITREDVIVRNPGVVARLVAAHKKALELIRERRAQEILDVVLRSPKGRQVFSGLERELSVKMIDRIKPGFGTGCLSKRGFDVEMKIAVDYGVVRRPISFEEFAEARFAGRCLD